MKIIDGVERNDNYFLVSFSNVRLNNSSLAERVEKDFSNIKIPVSWSLNKEGRYTSLV